MERFLRKEEIGFMGSIGNIEGCGREDAPIVGSSGSTGICGLLMVGWGGDTLMDGLSLVGSGCEAGALEYRGVMTK